MELEIILQPESSVTLWSHCLFTTVEHATHAMTARIEIQEGAALTYQDRRHLRQRARRPRPHGLPGICRAG